MGVKFPNAELALSVLRLSQLSATQTFRTGGSFLQLCPREYERPLTGTAVNKNLRNSFLFVSGT